MRDDTRVLLGAVPFGCNNVGDEAILDCIVGIVRKLKPSARITVSTRDEKATANRLHVETCPLLGFDVNADGAECAEIVRKQDVFVWSGATGLSDYPEVALQIMETAQQLGKKTVVWGAGMNSELNPAHYKVQPGPRRTLLRAATRLSLGVVDAVQLDEQRRSARAKRKISQVLNRADLLVSRDPETREQILQCGVTKEVVVGADSALLLEPMDIPVRSADANRILSGSRKKIGVCISAQRPVRERQALIAFLDTIIEQENACVLFIPMNPETDCALMRELWRSMRQKEHAALLEGVFEPGQILRAAADMDVIVSSRLHLLIFAAIVNVPSVGIARGSKFSNFLTPLGLKTAGEVERSDFDLLKQEVGRLLRESPEQRALRTRAVDAMRDRLSRATVLFGRLLDS